MSTNFCTSCGGSLAAGSAFCGSCGHRVTDAPQVIQQAPTADAQAFRFEPYIQDAPKSPAQVSNGFAWTLACVPLILVFSDAIFLAMNAPTWVGYLFSFALNSALVVADSRRLEAQGHKLNMWLGLFLIPVYLYQRAKMLRDTQAQFITWIVLFVLTLFV